MLFNVPQCFTSVTQCLSTFSECPIIIVKNNNININNSPHLPIFCQHCLTPLRSTQHCSRVFAIFLVLPSIPCLSSNVSQIKYQKKKTKFLTSSNTFLTMLNTFGVTSVLPDVVNISWRCPTSFNVFLMLPLVSVTLVLFDAPIVP